MKKNLKNEFLRHIESIESAELLCVKLNFPSEYKEILLYPSYSNHDYEDFLKKLDLEYDSGFGSQEIFGNIWYKDGTFSQREEYDGSEWFKHISCPKLPLEFKSIIEKEKIKNTIVEVKYKRSVKKRI